MVFSSEDKFFIKNLVLLKGYSSRRLIKEFPQKGWNKNGLDVLLRKIRAYSLRYTCISDFQVSPDSAKLVLRRSGDNCLHCFVENLFNKQSAKFIPNRPSFMKVMVKQILVCVFMPHSVHINTLQKPIFKNHPHFFHTIFFRT